MIINIQAFNTKAADSRKIYEALDDFQSRRPIDVIAKNRPILILDEPQKMGGDATQESLKNFNPLFAIHYSATHRVKHNLVHVLDALDAYNQKLVKKIEVKGFQIKNLRGTNGYLYLQKILISANKPPRALIEIEIDYNKSINRETRWFDVGDNIYNTSKKMNQYQNGFTVSEINPINNSVTFLNGEVLSVGNTTGDVAEIDIRRIQIRETILSHFDKEEELFDQGIKVLSLFFIDEVAKYREYDDEGNPVLGIYGRIFEEEYLKALNAKGQLLGTPYDKYLNTIQIQKTHSGYFSIDKKGRAIDSNTKRNSDESDDISAYDLILKQK
jgi:type III restriction enzyme